jgi:transcriptional regulator with XRE-family HTH domain
MSMAGESPDRAFADVCDILAANLHRLRTARRLSLATLATRADLAKATLANLEQGRGNPTIETLWSLAIALGVPFSDLLEDRRETTTVVVRSEQGARVRGSTPGGQLDLRLLDRIEGGAGHSGAGQSSGLVEIFDLFLPAGTEHLGSPHGIGVVERVLVHEGSITVGPAAGPLTLGPGDYARYSGDGPHVYRSGEQDCRGVLLVGYPPS